MKIVWQESVIQGLFNTAPFRQSDNRGMFSKVWTSKDLGPGRAWDEVYFSTSCRGTVRGFHVQCSRDAGARLVFVTSGQAMDFVVDLRRGSSSYSMVEPLLLDAGRSARIIPPGCAHAFEALEDNTTMVYLQQGVHNAETDIGVRWDSVGATFSVSHPVISERDASLPRLEDFDSPFEWSDM